MLAYERDSHKHDLYKHYMSVLMRGILISTLTQAYERAYERDSHKQDHTNSI